MYSSTGRRDAPNPSLAHDVDGPSPLSEERLLEIHRAIYQAFEVAPDSANILQGVRAFRKGRPHVRVVLFPSPKNGGVYIPCEGRPEAKMAGSLEIDPDVRRYRSQPLYIPGPDGQAYVPDFVAEHHDGTFTVIDVKPEGQLSDPDVIARMKYVRMVLKHARLRHRIVTELELEAQPALQVRQALRHGAAAKLAELDRERLLAHLAENTMTVGDFRRHALSLGIDLLCIEKLALLGDIRIPNNTQWAEFAPLEVTNGNATHEPAAGWSTVHAVRILL